MGVDTVRPHSRGSVRLWSGGQGLFVDMSEQRNMDLPLIFGSAPYAYEYSP